MTRIINIEPVQRNTSKDTDDDGLDDPKVWTLKHRPASLIITDAPDLFAAKDFAEIIKSRLTPILGECGPDYSITPPAKSYAHGNRYILRVDATDKLHERIEIYFARTTNPPHAANKKSFIELLDETFRADDRFHIFIDKLLHEWSDGKDRMSPDALCQWMKTINPLSKLTNSAIYQMLAGGSAVGPRVIANMLSTFVPQDHPLDVFPVAPNLRYRHALKIYRVTNGKRVDTVLIQKLIDQAQQTGKQDILIRTLVEGSGINPEKLFEWSGLDLNAACHHRCVSQRDVEAFINLINPPTLDIGVPGNSEIAAQNLVIAGVLTGRPLSLSVDEMLVRASKSDQPARALFNMLLGPSGKTQMNDKELASHISRLTGRSYTEIQINYRRLGKLNIIESEAVAITTLIGCPAKQVEPCIEVLTGIASPEKLLDRVDAKENGISIAEMFKLSRIRKGMKRGDFGLVPSGVLLFENENTPVRQKSACLMADGLRLKDKTRDRFIDLATHFTTLEAQQIVELVQDAIANPSKRPEALEQISLQTRESVVKLAQEIGMPSPTLSKWIHAGEILSTTLPVETVFAKHLKLNDVGQTFRAAFRRAFVRQGGRWLNQKTANKALNLVL